MKIYLAAMWSERDATRNRSIAVQMDGHEVTSRWLNPNIDNQGEAAGAEMDLEDIDRSDVLILFTLPLGTMYSGGGRQWEAGHAHAKGKRVIICGDREHVFCHLPSVEVYDTFDEVREVLRDGHQGY